MLAQKFRLRKKEEVNLVFKTGRSISTPELALRFLPNQLPGSRFAILVGVKLSKKAVVRNRIRRRLREIARLNFTKIPSGFDLLIVARNPKLLEIGFADLTASFLSLVSKLPTSKKL